MTSLSPLETCFLPRKKGALRGHRSAPLPSPAAEPDAAGPIGGAPGRLRGRAPTPPEVPSAEEGERSCCCSPGCPPLCYLGGGGGELRVVLGSGVRVAGTAPCWGPGTAGVGSVHPPRSPIKPGRSSGRAFAARPVGWPGCPPRPAR